jgi:hypothetical protein
MTRRKKKPRICDQCDVACETTRYREAPHARLLCEMCFDGQKKLITQKASVFTERQPDPRAR